MALLDSFSVMFSPEASFGIPCISWAQFSVLALRFGYQLAESQPDRLPKLNLRKSFELTSQRPIVEFVQKSKDLLSNCILQYRNKPYKLMSE